MQLHEWSNHLQANQPTTKKGEKIFSLRAETQMHFTKRLWRKIFLLLSFFFLTPFWVSGQKRIKEMGDWAATKCSEWEKYIVAKTRKMHSPCNVNKMKNERGQNSVGGRKKKIKREREYT